MPKGVEHPANHEPLRRQPQVIPSLMPKGVEHLTRGVGHRDAIRIVIPSLMPKGVEHLQLQQELSAVQEVIPSLMPKGVEHCENWEPDSDDDG